MDVDVFNQQMELHGRISQLQMELKNLEMSHQRRDSLSHVIPDPMSQQRLVEETSKPVREDSTQMSLQGDE